MVVRKIIIVLLAITVFQNFYGCTVAVNKSIVRLKNGVLLICQIMKINNSLGKHELCRVKGNLYVINESMVEKKLNLRELALKINNQVCSLDDKWKQLLFEFKIMPNQIIKFEINTKYAGTLKNNDFCIEIIWPKGM